MVSNYLFPFLKAPNRIFQQIQIITKKNEKCYFEINTFHDLHLTPLMWQKYYLFNSACSESYLKFCLTKNPKGPFACSLCRFALLSSLCSCLPLLVSLLLSPYSHLPSLLFSSSTVCRCWHSWVFGKGWFFISFVLEKEAKFGLLCDF